MCLLFHNNGHKEKFIKQQAVISSSVIIGIAVGIYKIVKWGITVITVINKIGKVRF